MSSNEDSVFTTIGWDGGKEFFALGEHLERLKKYAKLKEIEFKEITEKNIISLLKNKKYKQITTSFDKKLGKPPGLITIRLHFDGSLSISERSNDYNLKCKEINAITISVTENMEKYKGIKFGKHLLYKNALNIAKSNNGNTALIIDAGAIIDGDRASLIILDKNGIAWASSNKYGSIKSVTLELIKNKISKKGIPLFFGKITPKMILQSTDAVMVGTGMGVTRINSIDNRIFNFPSSKLFDSITEIFNELSQEKWF